MSAETNRQNGRVYLDHAATTDVLPAAIDAMVEPEGLDISVTIEDLAVLPAE